MSEGRKYRVIVVDDEVLIREAVSENIKWEELGYELAASLENGRDAMEFVKQHPVDVVLTDICMPYVDGMDLSQFLYENYPRIQIIILSGYDEFEYAKRALKYDVNEYILKPITAMELSEVLANLKGKMDEKRAREEDIDRLSLTYQKNKLLIRSNALASLILGSKSEEESRQELAGLGISLDAAAYLVAVVDIDLYSGMYEIDEREKKESALMAFAVYNIMNEIVGGRKAGYVCQGKDNRTYVLFAGGKSGELKKKSMPILEEGAKQVRRLMGLKLTIGIGSQVQDLGSIYKSYEQADHAVGYRYVYGGGHLIDSAVTEQAGGLEAKIDSISEALVFAVKVRDEEGIRKLLEELETSLRAAAVDKTKCCLYIQRAVVAIRQVLKAADMEHTDLYGESQTLVQEIARRSTLHEAVMCLSEFCRRISGELASQRSTGGQRYAMMAMDYIEKNYADPDINLNSICGYLNISTSRFSTIFKNATGSTFMEVLINLRMEKARELLEHTDLKNYEIAERVGFSDPHYFSVSFKKITGKTPTEYVKEKRR